MDPAEAILAMAVKVPARAVVMDVAVAALTAAVMVVTDAALGGVTRTNHFTLEDVCRTRRRLKGVMLTCTALLGTPRNDEMLVCSSNRTSVAP